MQSHEVSGLVPRENQLGDHLTGLRNGQRTPHPDHVVDPLPALSLKLRSLDYDHCLSLPFLAQETVRSKWNMDRDRQSLLVARILPLQREIV